MCRRVLVSILVAVGITCVMASSGVAQEPYVRGAYGPYVLPLDRILPQIRHGRAGRFYDAEGPFPDANGGYHYRIKWLTPQGRVIWLDTDARSGRVLGIARGDWRQQGPPPVGADEGGPYREPYGPPRGRFQGLPGGPFGGPSSAPYGQPPREPNGTPRNGRGSGRGGFGFGNVWRGRGPGG